MIHLFDFSFKMLYDESAPSKCEENMEFSILVPVYNASAFLSDAVDSVLEQDFSDYELVLADDGSTDESGALCDVFAAAHPETIRTLHLPHRGLIATRRDAIRAAQGEFIVWLDADDLLEPHMLRSLHEKRLQGDPDIILYEFTAFFEDGRADDRRAPLFEDGTAFEGEDG